MKKPIEWMLESEWRVIGGIAGVLVALFVFKFTFLESGRNQLKHIQSNIVGLNRKITLFDTSGKELRSWTTKTKVEDRGGTLYFLNHDGKAVIVSGTFVVEEQ